MRKTRTAKQFCKLQGKEVLLLEEAISEMGRTEVMKWRIKKCLAKDRDCEKVGCRHAPSGIGDGGNKEPF